MTKDVLVSISGHHINIMSEPDDRMTEQEYDGDEIEVVTPASWNSSDWCYRTNSIFCR